MMFTVTLNPTTNCIIREVKGVPERIGKNRKDLEIKAVEAMENYLYNNPKYNGSNKKSFGLV